MVSAKSSSTTIAVKLVAAGAEKLATDWVGTGTDFEDGVSAIFVVLDWKALEKRVTGGAGSGIARLSVEK